MIYNILVLLATNVLIPLIPLPPQVFLSYSIYSYQTRQISVFEQMNLTRHYNPQQFRKTFRESMKQLHPDRGGSYQAFTRVKDLKEIMQNPNNNYYDMYNVTNIDLTYNQPMKQIVSMKELLYYFETIVFYFIALLYILAFTIDQELKPSRKILLPLTLAFAYYQYHIHTNPHTFTLIDLLISDKIPLFTQTVLIKQFFCVISAIIRTRYLRKMTPQKECFKKLQKKEMRQVEYDQVLSKLLKIQSQKLIIAAKNAQSWPTKIKQWLSKMISLCIFGLMIWNMISVSDSDQQSQIL